MLFSPIRLAKAHLFTGGKGILRLVEEGPTKAIGTEPEDMAGRVKCCQADSRGPEAGLCSEGSRNSWEASVAGQGNKGKNGGR